MTLGTAGGEEITQTATQKGLNFKYFTMFNPVQGWCFVLTSVPPILLGVLNI